MYPELFHIGPLTIHTYGVFFALGILAAVSLAEHLHRRDGGEPGAFADLSLMIVIGVLIGARALFIIVNWGYFLENPSEIPMIWQGGLVFYGGLLGGSLAFLLAVRLKRLDLWQSADTIAPALALGHAIGRIGCFFAGSCYGKPTDLPWAVIYTHPKSLAQDILGVPVHPTQLYSSAALLILTAILLTIRSRKQFAGQVILSYGILYGTWRFLIEFLRGDPRGALTFLGMTLSTSQVVSLFLVPLSIAGYLYLRKRVWESSQYFKIREPRPAKSKV